MSLLFSAMISAASLLLVSVRVATVARSEAVAVAKLAMASAVSSWRSEEAADPCAWLAEWKPVARVVCFDSRIS